MSSRFWVVSLCYGHDGLGEVSSHTVVNGSGGMLMRFPEAQHTTAFELMTFEELQAYHTKLISMANAAEQVLRWHANSNKREETIRS